MLYVSCYGNSGFGNGICYISIIVCLKGCFFYFSWSFDFIKVGVFFGKMKYSK